jgi:hypothetical protein
MIHNKSKRCDTKDLINNDDRFSTKGSLMFRVQQYFNDLNM